MRTDSRLPDAGRPGRGWMAAAVLIAWASAGSLAGLAGGQVPAAGQRLALLLSKAKAYCLRLETAALDFTCIEKIAERTYAMRLEAPDVVVPNTSVGGTGVGYSYKPAKMPYYENTYVYDYQFVRRGAFKTEKRVLLEENGRKKKEREAELTTATIRVQNALFGPIGLVGESAQSGHDYRIVDEETVKGKTVVIVEAVPKPGLERQHCYGRIWIREADGSIARIAWDQASVGNFQVVQARAREYRAEPQLTSLTEYGMEKNGLRFPSKDTTEEAYIKSGQKYVQALTTILYMDYRFFTVETAVQY
jgi:hypothetical protein